MNQALQFFTSVAKVFAEAAQKSGLEKRYFKIGGYCICMEFAGSAFSPFLTAAIEHLQIDEQTSPHLTIRIWDSASTNTPMITSPLGRDAFANHGELREYNTDRIYTLFQAGEDTLNMLDVSENIALFWRRDTCGIPYYTVGAPFRSLIHWWMNNNDRQLLHAAAVGTGSGAALIVGKGGSGKSTTALSCLQSDLFYVGDDYTLLSLTPSPQIHSIFNSAKLDVEHMRNFPYLASHIYNNHPSEEDKYLILLHKHFPEKLSRKIPIKVILLPRVTGKLNSTFSNASPTSVLTALAPSTLFQLSRNRAESFHRLAALVKQVPGFVLHCGTAIDRIPAVISKLLNGC